VEVDFTFRCLGFEIRGSVANLQRHGKPPSLGLSGFSRMYCGAYVRLELPQYQPESSK
jgi:hypothetical protein